MTNLLVELLVEELPPKTLELLGAAFAEGLARGLRERGFLHADSVATAFASPRRLAAHVTSVLAVSTPREVPAIRLMPAAVGLDPAGRPTPPLIKKIQSHYTHDVDIDRVMREQVILEEEGGKRVVKLRAQLAAGGSLLVGLEGALHEALERLPIPKVMRYQLADGWSSVDFVRPAHGLVALHGATVMEVMALGLTAGRKTRGHRFEAAIDPVVLRDADSYARQLEDEGAVIASFEARRAVIAAQLREAAAAEHLEPIDDAALLDEVTALVERPNVLVCRFETGFLEVPPEVLVLTMKANQKYFPLLDASGRLTHKFLVVSNIRPADVSRVVEGNERVVRPRLADAKFFFDQDRKKTLASRLPGLDQVVYHARLGSQGARSLRVVAIVRAIAARLAGAGGAATATGTGNGPPTPESELTAQAVRAAALAKADLLTDMVGEFPELQGTMGAHYARHDGEPEAVAVAIEDHYRPRFAGDALPRTATGTVVALADKLETLVGLFGVGQLPSGDKDPFALRRHALGVIRMLVDGALPLDLGELLEAVVRVFDMQREGSAAATAAVQPALPALLPETAPSVAAFIYERLAGVLREQGYAAQEIEAVLALRPQRLADVAVRLAAVRAFSALPQAAALAAANKRVGNILRKAAGPVVANVDPALLRDPAEVALCAALAAARPVAEAAWERGDYTASLQALAALRDPVDAFFDSVMVNAEEPELRANRLGLLAQLHGSMNRVADLSKLAS